MTIVYNSSIVFLRVILIHNDNVKVLFDIKIKELYISSKLRLDKILFSIENNIKLINYY